jgi:hypothetical protein
MNSKDFDKVYELKEKYYNLHSKLINHLLEQCDNEEQKESLLEQIAETNSPYGRKKE